MKLPLQLAASILLTSVCASGWPYHEIVGVGQSATPVFVAPVYGVAPAISLLTDPAKETETIIAGPVTGTTIVEGSSSGPVTIVSPGNVSKTPVTTSPPTAKPIDVPVDTDSVLIKGASAGPVTLVAPSAGSNNAPSAGAETKKGAVAASAEVDVATRNGEESSETSTNADAIIQSVGIASAKAVIGPSTGPIVIVGPTAPPIPTTPAPTTPPTILTSTSSSISVSSSTAADASMVDAVPEPSRPDQDAEATNATTVESSASGSTSATLKSEDSVVSASARVNIITPRRDPVAEALLANVVASAATDSSAIVSGPLQSISTHANSAVLLRAPL